MDAIFFQTIFFSYSYKFKMVRMLQYCTLKTPAFLCFMEKKFLFLECPYTLVILFSFFFLIRIFKNVKEFWLKEVMFFNLTMHLNHLPQCGLV